jgi:guanosine-3',5'-bis(diphosphate) 3'-pyrophosphohydrolase
MQIFKSDGKINTQVQTARKVFVSYASQSDHDSVTLRQHEALKEIMNRWRASTRLQCGSYLLLPFQHQFISQSQISQLFSPQVTQFLKLIDQLKNEIQLSKAKVSKATSIDRLRRLLIYAYSDHEITLFAMAQHLAQGELVEDLEDKAKEHWIANCEHIYLRLFEMFGLSVDGAALYNRFLQLRSPDRWNEIEKIYQSLETHIAVDFISIREQLENELAKNHVENIVVEQIPWQRELINSRNHKHDKFSDIGFRTLLIDIYTDNDLSSYQVLGIVHRLWRPQKRQDSALHNDRGYSINNSFQDFIARPQRNGYRALVTTVHFPVGQHIQTIKFCIQTHAQREVNQYGVIAARRQHIVIQNAWWDQQELRRLLQPLSAERESGEIAVFTADGGVLHSITQGTTILDIAFKVHSELGIHASTFWLNGKSVDPATAVHHFDFIEIEYDPQHTYLKPEWEQIAYLRSTRRQIRQLLKQQAGSSSTGRALLDSVLTRECQICGFYLPKERIEEGLTAIAAHLGYPSLDVLYTKIEEGFHTPDRIVVDLIEAEYIKHIVLENGDEVKAKRVKIAQMWMQEPEPVRWNPASRVIPGVPIVGRYTGDQRNHTLLVYRRDANQAPTGADIVPLKWRSMIDLNEAIAITVKGQPRSFVIGVIFNALYSAGENEKNNLIVTKFESEIRNDELHIEAVAYAANSGAIENIKANLETNQRSGYISDYKIWQLFPTHKMLVASIADRRRHNPYTIRDVRTTMFFGREQEIQRITHAINTGHAVVLYGQKRIGKTSLLNRLTEMLLPQQCNAIPVMLDVLSLMPFDTVSFLKELTELSMPKIQQESRKREHKGAKISKFRIKSDEHPFKTFGEWVNHVQQQLSGKRLVFLIDEFTRADEEYQQGNLDQQFFQGLQWLISTSGVSFIFCIHEHIVARENSSITGLFQRSEPVQIAELDPYNARRLVEQPLEDFYQWEPQVVDRVIRLTNGHPFYIQALCQELISNIAYSDTTVITSEHLDNALRLWLRQGDHYFNHYRHRVQPQDWEILKVIAYITHPDHPWASSNKIRNAVSRYLPEFESLAISKSISVLRLAGFLEGAEKNNQPSYSISMELFHLYLQRIVTHLTVSRDLQREE